MGAELPGKINTRTFIINKKINNGFARHLIINWISHILFITSISHTKNWIIHTVYLKCINYID